MSESTTNPDASTEVHIDVNPNARKTLDDLPSEFSWVAEELTRVRSEAAEKRTKLREAQEQIDELASFREKAAEASDRAAEIEISLHRERAARKHGLDGDQFEFLAELTDPEVIDQRAERLAAMTQKTARPVDPTQGSTSTGGKPASTADQFAAAVEGAFTR